MNYRKLFFLSMVNLISHDFCMTTYIAELSKKDAADIHSKLLNVLYNINDNIGNLVHFQNKLDRENIEYLNKVLDHSVTIYKGVEQDSEYLKSLFYLPAMRDVHALLGVAMESWLEQEKIFSVYMRRHAYQLGELAILAAQVEPYQAIIKRSMPCEDQNPE
jgi:hypothetical protein